MKKLLAASALLTGTVLGGAAPALAQMYGGGYGRGYGGWGPGMMWGYGGWGGGGGWFPFPLFPLLFLILIVAGAVFFFRRMGHCGMPPRQAGRTALDILKERYARGEIDKEEFEERRRTLGD